jgi:hypothetical protein
MPEDKKRENRRRVGKVKAVRAMTDAKNNILDQPVPTPMGEPHRIVEPLHPEEERVLRLLKISDLPANTSKVNLDALQTLREKGRVRWDAAAKKWKLQDHPVVTILNAIVALSDDDMGFLLSMLDSGMWDEWDCGLHSGIEMFGAAEIRFAAKSGVSTAKWLIDHPTG